MKKLMLITALLALMAAPALATTSLGYWNEGDPNTTHQFWDFTPGSRNPPNPNQFFPESEFNPNDGGHQVFAQTILGTWDGQSALKSSASTGNMIIVDLEITNYPTTNPCKYIWVDLGLTSGNLVSYSVTGSAPEVDVAATDLPGPGPGTGADFGFLLKPNPYFEDILITIQGSSATAPAVLDWVHVDTICTVPPILLETPNGGEVLTAGNTYLVTWSNTGSISNVLIEYSTDNGSNWTSIDTVPNTGSYNWLVPTVNSNQCLVRVSDANNLDISCTSDAVFTIETHGYYGGGSGTTEDPYLIYTAAEMNEIGANPADWDKYFKLMADIDLSGYTDTQFNIIGNEDNPFTGVFDGNSHVIRNADINQPSDYYVGLFGYILSPGQVENLGVENATINGNSEVGGLVGENDGSISNCYSTGQVNGFSDSYFVGGLVGDNTGNISNCYSTGTVTGGFDSSYLGGLVGYSDGTISNCYSTGTVTGGFDSSYLGGLVGSNDGTISSCYFLITSGPDNGFGTLLTNEQMKQQASFVGWDFVWETVNGTNDIWAICEGVSYPKLTWQFIPGDFDNNKKVDFTDFAMMGSKWHQTDSTLYCGGTDLTGDGWVDLNDLVIFAENWLEGVTQ